MAKHEGGERGGEFVLSGCLPKQTCAVGQEEFSILNEPLQGDQGVIAQTVNAIEDQQMAVDGRLDQGRVLPERVAVLIRDALLEQFASGEILVENEIFHGIVEHRGELIDDEAFAAALRSDQA